MEARAEVARVARAMNDRNNNQPPMPGVYPDYPAPVVVATDDGSREMRNMRWGCCQSKGNSSPVWRSEPQPQWGSGRD